MYSKLITNKIKHDKSQFVLGMLDSAQSFFLDADSRKLFQCKTAMTLKTKVAPSAIKSAGKSAHTYDSIATLYHEHFDKLLKGTSVDHVAFCDKHRAPTVALNVPSNLLDNQFVIKKSKKPFCPFLRWQWW